jgi:hypothetical protein
MALKEHKPHIVVATPGRLLKVGNNILCYIVLHLAAFCLAVCSGGPNLIDNRGSCWLF